VFYHIARANLFLFMNHQPSVINTIEEEQEEEESLHFFFFFLLILHLKKFVGCHRHRLTLSNSFTILSDILEEKKKKKREKERRKKDQ